MFHFMCMDECVCVCGVCVCACVCVCVWCVCARVCVNPNMIS